MRTLLLAPVAALVASLVLLALGAPPARADTDPVGVWPLRPEPEVVHAFDPPGSAWGAGHRGVDLAGRPGQAVRAALPGTVSFTGTIAGRGFVVVDHGDTRTTYEPVVDPLARGTRVSPGDILGRLAAAGSHCWPAACLHWGWLRGKTYLDPLRLVGGGPVRLLPLDGLPALGPASGPGSRPGTPLQGWRPQAPAYAGLLPTLGRRVPCPQARGWACW